VTFLPLAGVLLILLMSDENRIKITAFVAAMATLAVSLLLFFNFDIRTPLFQFGERFAWMEGVLILATIAQRWSLSLVPGHRIALQPLITLRPKHGMRMTSDPR